MNWKENWSSFKTYLMIERKQSEKSLHRFVSNYKKLSSWMEENNQEFSRESFNLFMLSLKEKGHKPSYLNNFIKFAKHLDKFSGTNCLHDYTYFKVNNDNIHPSDVLTPEEILKMADVYIDYPRFTQVKNLRMQALVLFLGTVGPRITETLCLKREWLLQNPNPTVYFPAEITKGCKSRYCVIPHSLYEKLQDVAKHSPDDTVFGLKDRTAVADDLKKRALACGINKRVFNHLFRHSSITNKLAAGIPLEIVTSYHGHSSTDVTYKYYVHLQAQQMAEYLNLYDPFFNHEVSFEDISSKVMIYAEKLLKNKDYTKIQSKDKQSLVYQDNNKLLNLVSDIK